MTFIYIKIHSVIKQVYSVDMANLRDARQAIIQQLMDRGATATHDTPTVA